MTMSDEARLSLYQLLRPAILADPHTLYRRIREQERVRWDRFMNSWVVTGYAEAVTALKLGNAARTPTPDKLHAAGLEALAPYADLMRQQLLFLDAPDHGRVRSVCAMAFTPARVAHLRRGLEAVANDLLTNLNGKQNADMLADFASPFAATMLADTVGVPHTQCAQLKVWACDLGELLGNFEHEPDRIAPLVASLQHMRVYMEQEVRQQQHSTGSGAIGAMLQAQAEGAPISFDEIVANAILLVGGGLEETTNLIANGLYSLLCAPDQWRLLCNQPDLADSAVEELLRYESTTQYTGRIAPTDMALGGKQIQSGQAITVVLAAANRDPERFTDPERLDLQRIDNRHLAFSWAAHYCLGAPLVRLAATIAFPAVARHFPDLAFADVRPRWRGMAAMRGLHALPVTLQARFAPQQPIATA